MCHSFCHYPDIALSQYGCPDIESKFWGVVCKKSYQAEKYILSKSGNLDTVVSKEKPQPWWVPFHSTQVHSRYMYCCVQKSLGYKTGTWFIVFVTPFLKWRSGLNFFNKKKLGFNNCQSSGWGWAGRLMDIIFLLNYYF